MCVFDTHQTELFVQIPWLHVLQLLSCDSDSDAARYCTNEQWHWLTSAENCCFTTVTARVFTWLISFELVFESCIDFSLFPLFKPKKSKHEYQDWNTLFSNLVCRHFRINNMSWLCFWTKRPTLLFVLLLGKRITVQNFAQCEIYVNHFIDPFKHSWLKSTQELGKKCIFRQTKI